MSRRTKTPLHDVWQFATLLAKDQLVRWTELQVPANGDYGTIIDRPCLVEAVDDWDQKKYTSVSHHFATVANVENHQLVHLQFYNKGGDKDELLVEKSVEDIYLFPASGSTVTLTDKSQYLLNDVNLGSLTFKLDEVAATANKHKQKTTPKKKSVAGTVNKTNRKRKSATATATVTPTKSKQKIAGTTMTTANVLYA